MSSQASQCVDCQTLLDPKTQPLIQKLIDSTYDMAQIACRQIRDSQECHDVAKEITAGGRDPTKYMRTCSDKEVPVDANNFFLSGTKLAGCAWGVADVAALDTYQTIKSLPGVVDNVVSSVQSEQYCNSHLEQKRNLYDIHNSQMPDDLKVDRPLDPVLRAYSCGQLRESIYEEGRYLAVKKLRDAGYKFKDPDNLELLKLVKAKLHDFNIHVNCYSPVRQGELICKTVGYAISSVLVAPAIVNKFRLLAGLAEAQEFSHVAVIRKAEMVVASLDTQKTEQAGVLLTVVGAEKKAQRADQVNAELKAATLRSQFIQKYERKTFTTPKQNADWIKLGQLDEAAGNVVFADEENAFLKDCNKAFGKSFCTAATNFRKELFKDKIAGLMKNYEHKVLPYADYKSMRFAFKIANGGRVSKKFKAELAKAFDEANKEFADYLKENQLLDPRGKAKLDKRPEDWFHAGFGKTGDQASFAASISADVRAESAESNRLINFAEPTVKARYQKILDNVHSDFEQISAKYQGTELVDKMPFTDTYMLTPEVLDSVRKSKNLKELTENLNKFYRLKLKEDDVKLLKSYYDNVNRFMPPLRIRERLIANLTTAEQGGIAIDFRGLGALGRRESAQAITVSRQVKAAMRNVRINEVSLTKWIDEQKKAVATIIKTSLHQNGIGSKAVISGDDMVVIPDKPIPEVVSRQISALLAARENPSLVRMTDVSAGSEDGAVGAHLKDSQRTLAEQRGEIRNNLVEFGEDLEKETRTAVTGPIDHKIMKNVLLTVEIHEKPTLLISGGEAATLTAEQEKLIQKSFQESVSQAMSHKVEIKDDEP